jgi:hypothetical protein
VRENQIIGNGVNARDVARHAGISRWRPAGQAGAR